MKILLFLARLFALGAKKSAQKLNETWDKLEASTFASPDFTLSLTSAHRPPPSPTCHAPSGGERGKKTKEEFS